MNRSYRLSLDNVTPRERYLLDAVVALIADPQHASLRQRVTSGACGVALDQDTAELVPVTLVERPGVIYPHLSHADTTLDPQPA
jgi:hypothetical protein